VKSFVQAKLPYSERWQSSEKLEYKSAKRNYKLSMVLCLALGELARLASFPMRAGGVENHQ